MIQESKFQSLMKRGLRDEPKDKQNDEVESAMVCFFIDALSEEEIQKIERWLLR